MNKSYVSLERKVCVVCGKEYDTNSLLLDKHLRDKFEHYTVTGWGKCPECDKPGYVALVGADPDKSTIVDGNVKPDEAFRTGMIMWMKEEAFKKTFNVPIPEGKVVFIDRIAFEHLEKLYKEVTE